MTASTPATVDVQLGLLAGWRHINPGDTSDVESIVADLEKHLSESSGVPEWSEDVRVDATTIVRTVVDGFGSLSNAGVVLFAWWARWAQDEGVPIALMAAAVLAVLPSPVVTKRATGLAALSLLEAQEESLDGRTLRRQLIEINGATVLRIVDPGINHKANRNSVSNQVTVQYVVPLEGVPAVTLLTFVTPSHRHASALQPMFDAIASTLTVTPGAVGPTPVPLSGGPLN